MTITNTKEIRPVVYIISDSVGETAELVAKAAVSQFNHSAVEIRRIPYVNNREDLMEVLEEAAGCRSIIAYTLVVPELKEILTREAILRGIPTVDILGPLMDALVSLTTIQPKMEPGLVRKMDEDYFRKVDAIEFAVKYDDGKDPRGIVKADIVVIGVSRTSKTPLCMYLAHKRIKAANIPLVPEVFPPEELFKVPPEKIIGLTILPQQLNEIRRERLKTLGLTARADYASMNRIKRELKYAEDVMKKIGCTIIDVTNMAVEETASKVLEIYYKKHRNWAHEN